MKADKEFIRESVADIIGCEVSDIKDDTNFVKELEVNSIQMLEIVAAVEDEYDIEVKASDLSKYNTIDKIVSALEEM